MVESPLIVLTAGGTGGHVYPALAVANELQKRGYRVAWIGTRVGLEHRVVPAAGIDMHYLRVRGVRGKSFFSKLTALVLLGFSIFRALYLVRKLKPACVVGMGGFAAAPAGIAAWILRRPLVIHEQNAVAGTTNRLLAPYSKVVVAAFPHAFDEKRHPTVRAYQAKSEQVAATIPNSQRPQEAGGLREYEYPLQPSLPKRILTNIAEAFGKKLDPIIVGNPVRQELVDAGAAREYLFKGQRPLRILVLGGSLGAAPINDIVPGTMRRLERDCAGKFEIWHQTGEAHIEEMQQRYGGISKEAVTLAPFIEDMEKAYKWADIVLCRSGALTVSELAIMGRPAILVPLPQAIDDHQKFNARMLVKAGAAQILLQAELDSYRLGTMFRNFMAHPEKLEAMSAAAYRVGTPHATHKICDICEDLCNAR